MKTGHTKTILTINMVGFGFLCGALVGLLGMVVGYWISPFFDSTGWSSLLYSLIGLVLGYGIGVGLGTYYAQKRSGGKQTFTRAFFSSLSGLFLIVFLSEPLNLDNVPILMWSLLLIMPLWVSSYALLRGKWAPA